MMKKYVYFGILALLFMGTGVSALHPLSARAAGSPQILISEINWSGSKTSTADEWLELANTSTTDIDLSNWYFTGIGTSGGIITLPQGSMIKAQSTFLLANYNLSDVKTTLNVLPDYVTTAVSIPNSSLNVHLFMPDTTEVDNYVDTSTPDFGSTSPMTSIERNLSDLTWKSSLSSSSLLDLTQLGTPGSAVFLTPTLSEGEGATPETVIEESVVETTQTVEPVAETITVEPVTEPVATDVTIEQTDVPTEQPVTVIDAIDQSPPVEAEIVDTPSAVGTVEVTPIADTATDTVTNTTQTVTEEPVVVTTTVETPVTAAEPAPLTIPSFTPRALVINELLPSPDDADEWVELFNPGSADIALTGWTLKDASGKVTKLGDTTFSPHTFFLITNPSGKLNNSGDTVTLLDPSNNAIDSVIYGSTEIPAPKKGVALARDANGTWGTTTPTPGGTNVFLSVTSLTPTLSEGEGAITDTSTTTAQTTNTSTSSYVTQPNNTETAVGATGTAQSTLPKANHVSTKPTKTTVRVESKPKAKTSIEGTIIVPPGVFGKQTAFLNGTELYFNKADWPDLPIGSHIKVTGTMSENNGNNRLKISASSDIVLLGTTSPLPSPLQGEGDAIGNMPHGTLISFSGTVADKKGSTLTILLASGQAVPVVIPKGVPLKANLLTAGSIVDVTGVLKKKDGAWTVALRSADDIALNASSPLPSPVQGNKGAIDTTTSSMPIVGGGLLTSTLGALGYWYAKSKGLSLLTLIKA